MASHRQFGRGDPEGFKGSRIRKDTRSSAISDNYKQLYLQILSPTILGKNHQPKCRQTILALSFDRLAIIVS